jgi:hypothetical protein
MAPRALLLALVMLCHAANGAAAAVASGRNWRISIDGVECEAAESLLTLGLRIDYRGPRGPVEAPVSRLLDRDGKPHLPRSLVWTSGSKPLAELLSAGGLRNIQSENSAQIRLKFPLRDASGDLRLEFGDIRAFALTRKRSAGCEGLLQPDQIQAPRLPRAPSAESSKAGLRFYRNAYPCVPQPRGAWRTIEAEYPPYLASQLLVFGRGYLPSARQIELPMGRAPAQSYFYAGPDDLNAIEDAARRALAADFPEYRAGQGKYFVFNWGPQKAPSGNELYSIGIYDIRACSG